MRRLHACRVEEIPMATEEEVEETEDESLISPIIVDDRHVEETPVAEVSVCGDYVLGGISSTTRSERTTNTQDTNCSFTRRERRTQTTISPERWTTRKLQRD
eukprot:5831295-Amphidinium_carterae.1